MMLFSYELLAEDDNRSFTVKGVIHDKYTHTPISFATVFIKGSTVATISDENGEFTLKKIPNGEHTLEVEMLGYGAYTTIVEGSSKLDIHISEDLINIDEIVVTANRYATKKRESVSIVNTVSPKLFEQIGASSPADVLNFQTGMRVEWNCGNCGYPQLKINGLEGQYSQILIDSRPVMSSLTSVYGLELLPSSMIERVEVLRGGGSAIFGSNAIGGVVNIITKEPGQNNLSLFNQTSIFEGGGVDINTTLNGSLVSTDRKTGVFLFGSVRDRDTYDRNGDNFSEIPMLESQTIGFRGYHKIGLRSKISVEYHHLNEYRRGGDNVDRPPHEGMIAEELIHKIDGGGVKYDFLTDNEKGSFSAYSSFQNTNRDSYFGTNNNLDAYGTTTDFVFVGGTQFNYSLDKFLFMPSVLTVGAEYNHNDLNDEMLGYNRVIDQEANTVGGFFQNEWKNDKVSILLGVRVDKSNMVDNVIASPRISARYAPIDWLTLRGTYSTGYRAPQAYDEDLHVSAVGGDIAIVRLSDDLKTERSQTFNASLDYYKQFGRTQLNILVEGFHTELNDVFTLTDIGVDNMGNTILEKGNSTGAEITGLNFETRFAVGSKFNLQAGYTYQRSMYMDAFKWSEESSVKAQREMFRTPDSYGYITATSDITDALSLSLSSNFTGKMYVQHTAGYIEEDRTEITDAFVDLGFRAAYDIKVSKNSSIEIAGGIKNIFNTFQKDLDIGVNKDAGYFYGPALPRTFYISAKFFLF